MLFVSVNNVMQLFMKVWITSILSAIWVDESKNIKQIVSEKKTVLSARRWSAAGTQYTKQYYVRYVRLIWDFYKQTARG